MRDDERPSTDEWTTTEKARLDSLPRARVPSDLLKTRTVTELRKNGLVRQQPGSAISRAVWIAIVASVVFVAGGFVGYRLAQTRFAAQVRLATIAAEFSRQNPSMAAEHVVWF